ncbi:unnamed protein product [Amaranthus hypochondriacus]
MQPNDGFQEVEGGYTLEQFVFDVAASTRAKMLEDGYASKDESDKLVSPRAHWLLSFCYFYLQVAASLFMIWKNLAEDRKLPNQKVVETFNSIMRAKKQSLLNWSEVGARWGQKGG